MKLLKEQINSIVWAMELKFKEDLKKEKEAFKKKNKKKAETLSKKASKMLNDIPEEAHPSYRYVPEDNTEKKVFDRVMSNMLKDAFLGVRFDSKKVYNQIVLASISSETIEDLEVKLGVEFSKIKHN